jgi:hypothetical protein
LIDLEGSHSASLHKFRRFPRASQYAFSQYKISKSDKKVPSCAGIAFFYFSPVKLRERAKTSFIKYAKSIGADAIVITGTESTKDTQSAYVDADALKYN